MKNSKLKRTKKYKKVQKSTKKVKRTRRNFKNGGLLPQFLKWNNNSEKQIVNNPILEKEKFLKILDEYKTNIDNLTFDDLSITDDQSIAIKYKLKKSISEFYDNISKNNLSELNSGELRAAAGNILTKTVLIKLFAKCPDCGDTLINIDAQTKQQIINKITPLLNIPYTAFTDFEAAVKAEEKNSNIQIK